MSFTENSIDAERYEATMMERNSWFDEQFKSYSILIEKGRLDAETLQELPMRDDLKQALMEVISNRNKD